MSGKKRAKPAASPSLLEPPEAPGFHVHLLWTPEGERYISLAGEMISAEELCISAAEVVGELSCWDADRSDVKQLVACGGNCV